MSIYYRHQAHRIELLSPVELYVLIALKAKSLHVYGIAQEIELLSEYGATPARTTVKRIARRFVGFGWLEITNDYDGLDRYQLTERGSKALHSQALQWEAAAHLAKTKPSLLQ